MNIQQLRYARALCDERSFVGAAAKCSVTQPTLSNAIAQLEAELGCKLFDRNTRSVRLTRFGEQIMPAIREVVSAFERLQHQAKYLAKNQLTETHIGISPIIGISYASNIFSKFSKSQCDLKPVYREENLDELYRLLKQGQLDIVIAPIEGANAKFKDCIFHLLDSEPLVYVASSENSASWDGRKEIELSELEPLEFVLVPDACGLTRVTKHHFEKSGLSLRRYPGEASSYRVIQDWALLGLGSGILPESKLEKGDAASTYCKITNNGEPLTIDYYAFGKPNTISPQLFSQIWQKLTE